MSDRIQLTEDQRKRFLDLAGQLSPENLSCDGEASPTFVRRWRRELLIKWTALECEVGRKVSESEVWNTPEQASELAEAVDRLKAGLAAR